MIGIYTLRPPRRLGRPVFAERLLSEFLQYIISAQRDSHARTLYNLL